MSDRELIDIFKDRRALLEGHFKLSSGLHSDTYLQCAKVLEDPRVGEQLCRRLAEKWVGTRVDVVVGPAMGAVVMAYELGRALGCRGLFAERRDGQMMLRRGFVVEPDEHVMVVEDVVTTGKSTREVVAVLEQVGCTVVGVSSLVNRSGTNPFDPLRFESLLTVTPETWQPEACPLCARGVPIDEPGSRRATGG